MEIITGHTGVAHITPEQDAEFFRGICGYNDCVFSDVSIDGVTSIPSAVITSALTLHINKMQGMVCGRRYSIGAAGDTIEIASSAGSGKSRYDLICAKITTDESGVNAAEWEIISGTAAESPSIPEYVHGDLSAGDNVAMSPVFLVLVGETSITSVEMVATVSKVINTNTESKSISLTGAPWATLGNTYKDNTFNITLTRNGNMVVCNGLAHLAFMTETATLSECAVPVGYRPKSNVGCGVANIRNALPQKDGTYFLLAAASGSSPSKWTVGTDNTAMSNRFVNLTWITEDEMPE